MPSDDLFTYTDANRQAWSELEPRHRRSRFDMLAERFSEPGYIYLGEVEREVLEALAVQGKDVVQLACNDGREILSIRNMGARRCVGFDICDGFIEQGRRLAEIGKIEAEFLACDVYRIPPKFHGQFDIVFVSVGALILMPELPPFFSVARQLLRNYGHIFIYERHPVLDMFHWSDTGDPPTIVQSYYRKEPFVRTTIYDYWAKETYDSSPMYTFHHTLTDIFGGLTQNGFILERFEEHAHDISEMFAHFAELKLKPPLCYTLIARRGGA
jgi:SAM-dependent methyltransferase